MRFIGETSEAEIGRFIGALMVLVIHDSSILKVSLGVLVIPWVCLSSSTSMTGSNGYSLAMLCPYLCVLCANL